jgi:hypothetical protein
MTFLCVHSIVLLDEGIGTIAIALDEVECDAMATL